MGKSRERMRMILMIESPQRSMMWKDMKVQASWVGSESIVEKTLA
jgi:hypothetical protein